MSEDKEAKFLNEVYQLPMQPEQLEYDVALNQPFFEVGNRENTMLIGLDTILECLAVAQSIQQIPIISNGFWMMVADRYEIDLPSDILIQHVGDKNVCSIEVPDMS